ILAGLTEGESRFLLSLGHVATCRAGDSVLSIGDVGQEIFFILEGSFQLICQPSTDGSAPRNIHKFLSSGDIFGEIAFLSKGIRISSVIALENAMLLILSAKALNQLVALNAHIAAKVFKNLSR